jgi:hypothetical protein
MITACMRRGLVRETMLCTVPALRRCERTSEGVITRKILNQLNELR